MSEEGIHVEAKGGHKSHQAGGHCQRQQDSDPPPQVEHFYLGILGRSAERDGSSLGVFNKKAFGS